jgi:O-methyltransferase involved in polyketide biosynthesis
LLGAGFDTGAPSCWLLEGFPFYLPREGIVGILGKLTGLAHAGSQLGFDIVNTTALTPHPLTRPWIDMQPSRRALGGHARRPGRARLGGAAARAAAAIQQSPQERWQERHSAQIVFRRHVVENTGIKKYELGIEAYS